MKLQNNVKCVQGSDGCGFYGTDCMEEQMALTNLLDLTEEDKIYLAVKWGRLYKAEEWVALEKLYNEFMESFDIQGAARIDTLKMICKTSLKMNAAIDCGDTDTYQKLSRVYDAMMKSAKFKCGLCNTLLLISRVYIYITNNIYANGEA